MEVTTIQPFLRYFSNVRERTLRVIRCVPPDKVDWSYAPGRFTLGDLLRHIAVTERYLFSENVQGKPSRYTSHGKEFGETYDQILLLMDDLHKQSLEIFARLSDEDLQKKCPTPGGVQITTWKWLRSMAEHEIHHRGQLYLYLALLNVPCSCALWPHIRASPGPQRIVMSLTFYLVLFTFTVFSWVFTLALYLYTLRFFTVPPVALSLPIAPPLPYSISS